MKLGEAGNQLKQKLLVIYDEAEAKNIANILLETGLGYRRSDILLDKHRVLPPGDEEKLTLWLKRLLQHEPLQYVINKAWFYGMELYVDSRVLIPRPETEELVHWIVEDVKTSGKHLINKEANEADATNSLKIMDVGTGSGCIALALKKEIQQAEVWGCDTSDEALNVARRNGSELDIRVDFQGINFLDEQQQQFLPTVDIIVSNPPYIPITEKTGMQKNVVDHEPHTALFVPDDDPLRFYKSILQFSRQRLYEGGTIYLEMHENLSQEVADLFNQSDYNYVELKKDMQGKNRMLKVKKS